MIKFLTQVPKYLFLSVWALASLFPLYFMAVSATNTSADVISSRLLPGTALAENWSKLTAQQDVVSAMTNSTIYAVASAVLSLLVCSIAGYGFEIYHSKNKDRLMGLLLLTMMIPFAATMIPLFRLFAKLDMISTLPAVVLPTIATPFLILLFRQSARSFPHEIIEAARLDGLSEISIFFRMFLPTMRATYAAAAVITFMAAWNNFLWPKVILVDKSIQTMPMLVASLTSGYVTDYGMLMLGVLIASLPTMILFLILQRAFAEGITGAVK